MVLNIIQIGRNPNGAQPKPNGAQRNPKGRELIAQGFKFNKESDVGSLA